VRQEDVPQQAVLRHLVKSTGRREEAVALGRVIASLDEGVQQRVKVIRRHLIVAIHRDDDVVALVDRFAVTIDNGAALALIPLMPDQYDTRIALGNLLYTRDCAVGTGVVGHDDGIDVLRHAGQSQPDKLFFVIGGNYNSDRVVLVHGRSVGFLRDADCG